MLSRSLLLRPLWSSSLLAPASSRGLSSSAAASSPIRKVGCVGLGLMGHGIAQTSATSGFEVVAYEPEERFLESGRSRIEGSLDKLVQRGRMTEEQRGEALGRISYTTEAGDLGDVDLVVEAVIDLAIR